MQLFNIISERLPMVWFLLGLLFNALALYMGIESALFFIYLIVGWACCALGLAIFFLQLQEKPKQTAKTRLSPNFISAGETTMMPVSPTTEEEKAPEKAPETAAAQ